MVFFKICITILILCSEVVFAQSDLDRYYSLEREVANLTVEKEDVEQLIRKYSSSTDSFGSPTSAQKVLARLRNEQDKILKDIKTKAEEMENLEENLEVQAWDQRFGVLIRVNVMLGDVVRNTNCSFDGRQFFTSDKAFELWTAKNNRLDKKVAYYAHDNEYVNNCLEKTNNGTEKKVSYTAKFTCEEPDSYFQGPVGYQVSKENDQIVVSTKISFDYKGNPQNKQKSIQAMRNTLPCMKEFYARHGIKLNISFEFNNNESTGQSCDHYLNLWDEVERADSVNWASHKTVGVEMGLGGAEYDRCSLALHELGHLLGLADSYPSPECPDQRVGTIDDIMRSSLNIKPEEAKIEDNDLKKILKPICGE